MKPRGKKVYQRQTEDLKVKQHLRDKTFRKILEKKNNIMTYGPTKTQIDHRANGSAFSLEFTLSLKVTEPSVISFSIYLYFLIAIV